MVQNKSLVFKRVHETPTVAGQDIAVESKEFDLDQVCMDSIEPPTVGPEQRQYLLTG